MGTAPGANNHSQAHRDCIREIHRPKIREQDGCRYIAGKIKCPRIGSRPQEIKADHQERKQQE